MTFCSGRPFYVTGLMNTICNFYTPPRPAKLLYQLIRFRSSAFAIKVGPYFCSVPPRYMMPRKQMVTAGPLEASHDKLCMIKAMSALPLGASTPAGAKRGSFIKRGLSSPAHLIEQGGLETIGSNGSSSRCLGEVSVSS